MRAISGYGEFRQLPKDAVSVLIRGYNGEIQQILKLEGLSEVPPTLEKSGFERAPLTDEARALKKQVEEKKKAVGYQATDPATQLKSAMDAVHTRLQNEIIDLDKQILSREKIIKNRIPLEYDAEANRLKAIRDEKKKLFDEIFPKAPMTEAQRLQLWAKRDSHSQSGTGRDAAHG